MQKQTKHFSFELKAEGDSRTIEGLGSTFGNVDKQKDTVAAGAFTKSLQSRMPKMLWQHDGSQPIGIWEEAYETPKGLYLKGRILDTQLGNDVYKLAQAGAIDSMSIGYGTKDYSLDRSSGVRTLKQLDLYEVSLVTFPANDQARIFSVKADGEIEQVADLIEQAVQLCKSDITPEGITRLADILAETKALLDEPEGDGKPTDIRTLEKCLRDAGFSRKDAKAIASEGFKATVNQRDAAEQALTTLFNQFTA
jgi:uncharacterized protein